MVVTQDKNIIEICKTDDALFYLCEFITYNECGADFPFAFDKYKFFRSGILSVEGNETISINLFPKNTKTLDEFYGKGFSINYYSRVTISTKFGKISISNDVTRKDGTYYTEELKKFILNIESFIRDKKIESIGI